MIIILKEHQVGLGYKNKLVYERNIETIEDFKSSFIKRLGNIKENCNKSERELRKIKPIVKSETDIKAIVRSINQLDRWSIEVREWLG